MKTNHKALIFGILVGAIAFVIGNLTSGAILTVCLVVLSLLVAFTSQEFFKGGN